MSIKGACSPLAFSCLQLSSRRTALTLEHLLQRRWSSAPRVVSALHCWSPIRVRCSVAAYFMKRGHHSTPGPLRRPRAPPARNPAAAAAADALMALMPLPLIPLMPPSSFSLPGSRILNCVAPTLAHRISPPAGYLGRHPTIAKPRSLVKCLWPHAEIVAGRLNCIYCKHLRPLSGPPSNGSRPGFRIRIDLMRIRIRIRIQHFF